MGTHDEEGSADTRQSAPGQPGLLDTLASTAKAPSASSGPSPAGSARYARGRELGRGGMGRVVEAIDLQFQRLVAVKELSGDTDQGRRRFETEALITGNLEHPGIPSVYERGVDERGVPFYAMRKVRGRTLGSLLGEAPSLTERLALLPAVVRAAHTLGYAHERGVIHRDVKPENILVGSHGEVVMLDWGIARVRGLATDSAAGSGDDGAATAETASTRYGAVVGTPAYMSPEQASGRTDEIDERSDVFALGALLYHVLAGRMPYTGSGIDAVLALAREARPQPVLEVEPAAPRALADICARAMSRNPAERFRNASEVAKALESVESQALLSRPFKLFATVTSALVNLGVLVIVGTAIALVSTITFKEIGFSGWAIVAASFVGLLLSAVEFWTKGKYSVGPIVFAFAMATVVGGVAASGSSVAVVMKHLASLNDADQIRDHAIAGAREAVAGVTLGAALGTVQFVVWGFVRSRSLEAAKRR